jgi:general L-amino acid transport system permease protein
MMSDKEMKTSSNANHETEMGPPKTSIGIIGWLKQNLFSSWVNTLLTIISIGLAYYIVSGSTQWVLLKANWAVISDNFKLFIVGQYPVEELWRVWFSVTFLNLLLGLSWGMWKGTTARIAMFQIALFLIIGLLPIISMGSRVWLFSNIALLILGYFVGNKTKKVKIVTIIGWALLFPLTIFLLNGFGVLNTVGTNVWGGFLLTLLIAIVAIVFSFPLGVLLALGRRSNLPVVKWFSIIYIEFIRGVPLITILFVAQFMIPLFLGQQIELNNVLRAMIGFTMFSAAYLAENVRGGLQSLPRGQFEAAQALGLSNAKMTFFVILPQALRAVIPAMVGQFIGIFKDTSLVMIVGLIDLVGMGKKILANPDYLGTQMEVFLFIAMTFFIFCYMMSYVSRRIENNLGVGQR